MNRSEIMVIYYVIYQAPDYIMGAYPEKFVTALQTLTAAIDIPSLIIIHDLLLHGSHCFLFFFFTSLIFAS